MSYQLKREVKKVNYFQVLVLFLWIEEEAQMSLFYLKSVTFMKKILAIGIISGVVLFVFAGSLASKIDNRLLAQKNV